MGARSATLALVFASVGHFFAHLLMLLYPTVLLVIEGRWGMSYGELLSLSLGGFVLFGLGALPAGWLGDRWSAEHMMVVFFVGTGGAAIATGLAGSPAALAFGLAAIGLFGSIYHPVGTAARQEITCVRAPATSGAAARPMLPEIPFQPSARPRFAALRTSQAVPTG